MDLGIADDELATCVACGLCLPHCPTYRVTGEEALSPRGRVAAMRQVQWDGAEPDESFLHSLETCVQCRGCETACPSGVPFGRLIEPARETLVDRSLARPPRAFRLALRALRWHRLVLAGSSLLGLAQRLRLVPGGAARRLGLPARVPLRRPRLRPSGTDVWLFTGCVMDAWMRDIHADAQRVVEATGAGVALPGGGAACCGALALHAGLGGPARAAARRTMAALPGDAPILVDSAGCGAMLKDYGHLLGTPEAASFGTRIRDVHEWLAEQDIADRHHRGPGRPWRSRTRATCATSSAAMPRSAPSSPRSPTSSSWTTRACAAARAAPTPRCSPTWPGRSATASWPPSPAPAARSSPPPTRGAPSTWRPRGSRSATRARSWPRRWLRGRT